MINAASSKLAPIMDVLNQVITTSILDLQKNEQHQRVRIAGVITQVRPHIDKRGRPMGFAQLEDMTGSVSLVIFARYWEMCSPKLVIDDIVLCEGFVDQSFNNKTNVLITSVTNDFVVIIDDDSAFPKKETKINYYAYIESDEWKRKAEEAKKRAGFRCQICNKHDMVSPINAHHRTYERLGHELPEDITVLCQECHALFSLKLQKQQPESLQGDLRIEILGGGRYWRWRERKRNGKTKYGGCFDSLPIERKQEYYKNIGSVS